LDAKNRFVLPVALRQYIETKSKVVFVGVGSRIELWDEAVYQNYGKMRELQIRDTAIRHFNRITMRKEHDEDI
jgi:MraZ protein